MKKRFLLVSLAILSVSCSSGISGPPLVSSLAPTATVSPTPGATTTPLPKVTVPSLVFGSFESASAKLQQVNLRVEKIEERTESCIGNVVLRQDPSPGAEVEIGSTIKVYFCIGSTPTPAATLTPRPTSTPVFTGPARRLENGAVIKSDPRGAGAQHYIALTNNNKSLDAVAVLTQNNLVMMAVYVRAGQPHQLDYIWTGSYDFYYVMGEDWDQSAAMFTRQAEYHRFTRAMAFERLFQTNVTTFTYWNFTMDVGQGSSTPIISADQFPSLK